MTDTRMTVWKVLYDASLGSAVVLLQNETGERILPIWVGHAEALSIALASERVTIPRPLTHDLLKSILDSADLEVEWVRVTDIREGTYFGLIRVVGDSLSIEVDARPSDAIALALRADAPIFVAEKVLVDAMGIDLTELKNLENLEEDFLANLPDEIFGKYKM